MRGRGSGLRSGPTTPGVDEPDDGDEETEDPGPGRQAAVPGRETEDHDRDAEQDDRRARRCRITLHAQLPVMNSPPSTLMMSPLMKSVPGPDSATMAFATSWGVVIRPVGLRFIVRSIICWLSGIFRSAGVIVTPARMALIVAPVPFRASSIASCRK